MVKFFTDFLFETLSFYSSGMINKCCGAVSPFQKFDALGFEYGARESLQHQSFSKPPYLQTISTHSFFRFDVMYKI